MNRVTSYIAGVVTALAICAAALGFVAANAAAPAAGADSNALAAEFDLEVVWYDDDDQPAVCEGHDAAGCFEPRTPEVIYIQRDLGEYERSVMLHEIGHAVHYRLGLPADECAADAFAISLGATWTGYDC